MGERAHLIPAFDEYLVAYRDRRAVLDPEQARRHNAGGGMLNPCVLLDGRVVGTWRRELAKSRVRIALDLFGKTSRAERAAIDEAAERYAAFLGLGSRGGGDVSPQRPVRSNVRCRPRFTIPG